ncbi:MAG TPA: efflux RND transporter permease subunit, partial [Burkholderiales bacterium]|nr:efflux RND transporter permease subunit [Burkholderiales bacterium]
LLAVTVVPVSRLGGEFLPPFYEGDLLYMPTALPGISPAKAAEILQQTDKLIATVPEVKRVFGKIGRAETATDPAPLEMVETTVQLKPRDEWRPGMTVEKLVEELDSLVKLPGLSNIWIPPIRNRIDMLATGIKSPLGIKVAGNDLAEIERAAEAIERVVKDIPGVTSAFAERVTGGRYIEVNVDRDAASRFGLSVMDVQSVVSAAIGGENVGETIEGRRRFPINVRYPRELRDSLEKLRDLPMVTEGGAQIPLGAVARIVIADGPASLKSENARLSGWIYVDIRGRDLVSVVHDAQRVVAERVKLPAGVSLQWSGQFEYLERAVKRLEIVIPFMLAIIFVLLYLTFRRFDEAALLMATLPFALVGGVWYVYALGHNLSVASGVGFIALGGVAAEFGVVMLIYLKQALERRIESGGPVTADALLEAIDEGAVQRVRPLAMTAAVVIAGLAPIMWSEGAGAEIMQRIAAPMIGGMITAPLLSVLVIPAAYYLMRRRGLARGRLAALGAGGAPFPQPQRKAP